MNIINPAKNSILKKYPDGNIYQHFGENVSLYLVAIQTAGHNGIDIAMTEGTPIIATRGIVCDVKNTPNGYGKHIRILTDPDENGTFYELTYGHLGDIYCSIGDRVENGDCIGTMSNTGFVISGGVSYWGNAPSGKGVHLHFGVRECSTKDTGWENIYSDGKKVYIKNYENGLKGAIDPLPFIIEEAFEEPVIPLMKRVITLLKTLLLKLKQ